MINIAITLIQCVMRTASGWIAVLLLDAVTDAGGFAMKVPSPSIAPFSNAGPAHTLPNFGASCDALLFLPPRNRLVYL